MKIVWSWLGEYVDLEGVDIDEMCERWTLAGLEVAGIERVGDWWDRERLLVGAVVRVEPHPNADRLVLADVDLGAQGSHRVVTGAPNLLQFRDTGDLPKPLRVAFAREGAVLFDGHGDGTTKTTLQGRLVRGVMSDAMVCSEMELGLSGSHEGILILDDGAPLGVPLADVLGDAVIEIDILPNFARAMNVVGVARETAVLLGRSFMPPAVTVQEGGGDPASASCRVEIGDPELCPRYSARIVRNLKVAPSPFQMARRLTLSGMRPINNIVDITNYVMLEWGEPLHAFDYDKLRERADGGVPAIHVRRARPGETMTTLDGVPRSLDADTLLITDQAGALAIAGVMGGSTTEVGPQTTTVLLEAAAFDMINVRRTSRQLKIASESAARFGRGVAPSLVDPASRRAAELVRLHAGGDVAPGVVDAYPQPPVPVRVSLPVDEVSRVLGVALPREEIIDVLRRLEFAVLEDGDLDVTVPDHRLDVSAPADLIEEVARVHGYDRLPVTTMRDPLPPQRNNPKLDVHEAARDTLAAAGLQEIVSYRLVRPELDDSVLATASAGSRDHVLLANPISPERSALRRSILTGLLESVRANIRIRDRVALFELGPVFTPAGTDLPSEQWRIGIALSGPDRPADWRAHPDTLLDFFHAKGCVERLMMGLHAGAVWRPDPGGHPSMHPHRTAAVLVGDRSVGHVGELHPEVAEAWGLEDRPVAVADLDLDALVTIWAVAKPFVPFSPYPAVKEDLAVIVDEGVASGEVETVIRESAGTMLIAATLFDIYRGPQVGDAKKSLAWSLTLQAADKTLDSDEVVAIRSRIVTALEHRLGARLRS